MKDKIPNPPKPPLERLTLEGVTEFCPKCGSSYPRSGFLGLWGKRYCINKKCVNFK